jgi:hypothetical protein
MNPIIRTRTRNFSGVYRYTRHNMKAGRIEKTSNISSVVSCIRCHGDMSTELLPSNDTLEYIYRHIDWWERFMKSADEMGSGAMISIPSFIRFVSTKVNSGEFTDIQCVHKVPLGFWKIVARKQIELATCGLRQIILTRAYLQTPLRWSTILL